MSTRLLIELDVPANVAPAIRKLRALGFRRLEAYTPWPVDGVDEALELPRSPVPRRTLVAGMLGALTAYAIQWWTAAVDYPLDVGGRPAHAAPAFVLITFETIVLFAGLTAFFSVLLFARLPRLWDPVFEVEAFRSATIDRFWIGISDPELPVDVEQLRAELAGLGGRQIIAVEGSRR